MGAGGFALIVLFVVSLIFARDDAVFALVAIAVIAAAYLLLLVSVELVVTSELVGKRYFRRIVRGVRRDDLRAVVVGGARVVLWGESQRRPLRVLNRAPWDDRQVDQVVTLLAVKVTRDEGILRSAKPRST